MIKQASSPVRSTAEFIYPESSSLPPIPLIRSGRKTVAVQVTRDGSVTVRAPHNLPLGEIRRFVSSREGWIMSHLEMQKQRLARYPEPSEEELAMLTKRAKEILPSKVAFYARRMGLTPSGISFGRAKSRFGSCDGNNRLRFSCLLMRYPDQAIDYVVVHELAHIRHKNHGKAFYALIAEFLPDYKKREALLRGRSGE